MSSGMSSFRPSPIDRRRFMGGAGAGLIGLAAAPALLSGAFAQGRRWTGGDRSRWASPPARRDRTASSCGRGLRPIRCRLIRQRRAV